MIIFRKIFVGILTVLALFNMHCTQKGRSRLVDAKEADGMLKNRLAVLIDVREESELKESGMAEGAVWFPTSKVNAGGEEWEKFKSTLPKDKMVVIYCAVGGRAGKIAEKLADEGYQTGNMGGLKDWKAAGLPVIPPESLK